MSTNLSVSAYSLLLDSAKIFLQTESSFAKDHPKQTRHKLYSYFVVYNLKIGSYSCNLKKVLNMVLGQMGNRTTGVVTKTVLSCGRREHSNGTTLVAVERMSG